MPGRQTTVRPTRLRRRAKYLKGRPRRRGPFRNLGTGGFTLTRRMDPIYVSNTLTGGVPACSNTTIVTLGTPEALPISSGVDNYNLPFAINFSMKQLAQYTDITGICDRYKITGAVIRISYNANSVGGQDAGAAGTATAQFMPTVNYIVDKDDDGVQTCTQLRARTGLRQRVFKGGNGFVTVKCVPVPAPVVYDGVTSAYMVPAKPQWINSGYPDVPHYGVKGYFGNLSLLAQGTCVSVLTLDIQLTVVAKDLQ